MPKKPNDTKTLSLPWKRPADLSTFSTQQWIAKPWVAKGVATEIVGQAKAAGKSTFVFRLCRAILQSEPFLGEPTTPVKIAYLTEENDPTFARGLEKAGLLNAPDFHIIQWADVAKLGWFKTAEALRKDLAALGVGLLIIDTFPQFAFQGDDSENDATAALRALAPVQLITRLGVGVILVRHERKAGGSVGRAGRGSSAFGGGVDIILQVKRRGSAANTPDRIIYGLSRFEETPEEVKVTLDPDSGTYVYSDGRTKVETVVDDTSTLNIFNGEPLTIDQVAALTKVKRTTAQRIVTNLTARGLLIQIGAGRRGEPKKFKKVVGA